MGGRHGDVGVGVSADRHGVSDLAAGATQGDDRRVGQGRGEQSHAGSWWRIVVCQNGGVDAGPPMAARYPEMEPLPAQESTTPGLVYVSLDGKASYILEQGVNAPNDITVDGGGDLVFTDPGNPFHNPRPEPRLMRFSREGSLSVIADGFDYCNGSSPRATRFWSPITAACCVSRLMFPRVGHPLRRRQRRRTDGRQQRPDLRGPSGERRRGRDRGRPGGGVPGAAEPGDDHQCVLRRPGSTWPFVTDARNGSVSVFADMPVPGARVADWTPPQPSMDG